MRGRFAFVVAALALWQGPAFAQVASPRGVPPLPVAAAQPATPLTFDSTRPSGPLVEGVGAAPDLESNSGHGSGWLAGIGVYYVQPHFEDNPAFFITRSEPVYTILGMPARDLTGVTVSRQRDFHWDYEIAPRVWLGYVGEGGLGLRGRYWRFDEGTKRSFTNSDTTGTVWITSATPLDSQGLTPIFAYGLVFAPASGVESLAFVSDLELDVLDLEATQEVQAGEWSLQLAGGVRLTRISQVYNVFRSRTAIDPVGYQQTDTLRSRHWFEGLGPTAALEAWRPLGFGLSLYGSARGSVLFGNGKHKAGQVSISQSVSDPSVVPWSTATFQEAAASRDDILPIAEVEAGLEWFDEIGGSIVFLQAALVGQVWFDAGSASSEKGNLGLFGLSLSAGMQR